LLERQSDGPRQSDFGFGQIVAHDYEILLSRLQFDSRAQSINLGRYSRLVQLFCLVDQSLRGGHLRLRIPHIRGRR
jgi:hypothetical protein